MQTHNSGQPSGTNKSEGTGVPSVVSDENLKQDEALTGEFTDGDDIAGDVKKNPNRNVDKEDATNAGGYKN